ncbi:MAG: 50S ribosomal protein L4 [Chloroflexota bacterium]|nr:50S ribosomal protein L4 [Chloroflexota bacterium]
MLVPLYNQAGQQIGTTELRDDIFAVEPNQPVMHQALVRQLANARQGTSGTKTRGEVAGGGAKPWRQKGTGRARQGSTRAPHWRHGGVAFGPTPRKYTQRMPKEMRRVALRSALSAKVAEGQLRVVDDLKLDAPKTREVESILGGLSIQSSALILLSESNPTVQKSAANIADVKTLRAQYLHVRDLLGYDFVVMPLGALKAIEGYLGK